MAQTLKGVLILIGNYNVIIVIFRNRTKKLLRIEYLPAACLHISVNFVKSTKRCKCVIISLIVCRIPCST